MEATAERAISPGPWTPSRPVAPPTAPVYSGGRWRVFGLALSRMILTILTLGLGRFWMLTRLRRHYWSSVSLGGDPFEYTGRAGEKLIGFLVAVVLLAVWLLFANLALTFLGFSAFEGNPAALQLPLLAIAPLWFWARYRARRYVLSRTRWRGVRFGLGPGAGGYALRATLWWLATAATLGLLYPLLQHRLDRYLSARSRFGDLAFAQTAAVGPLFASWLTVWLPAVAVAAGLLWAGASGAAGGRIDEGSAAALSLAVFAAIGFALARHQVFAFRRLASGLALDGRTWARVEFGVWPVIGIWVSAGLVYLLAFGLATGLVAGLAVALVGGGLDAATLAEIDRLLAGGEGALAALGPLAALAAVYLPLIALWSALGHAFVTHPMVRLVCAGVTIHDLDAAARARQRPGEAASDAGGFADALGAGGF